MLALFERLLERWRATRTVEDAVALCTAVATSGEGGGPKRGELACRIAAEVAPAHAGQRDVQLATGRMLLAHRALDEAKRHLLIATKLAPGEPSAPQLLGETLLLQGDAERAARALNAALRAGSRQEACRSWYEAALAYIPYQHAYGAAAVAQRVAESTARQMHDEATADLDEEGIEDAVTSETRLARSPDLPSPPADGAAPMFPTDLEPPEAVPRDDATAIVGMDELRRMIERDLEEAERREAAEGSLDDAPEPTADLGPQTWPRLAEAAAPAPATTAPAAGAPLSPPIEAPVAPVAVAQPVTEESAPVVEVPASATHRRDEPKVMAESAPVVELPAEVVAAAEARRRDEESDEAPRRGRGAALTLVLLAILVGVVAYAVRSGRLPALEERLPPWVTDRG